MKYIFFFIAISLIAGDLAFSQIPSVKHWDYRYGGTYTDHVSVFQQTRDGGFILGGYSFSGISGDKSQGNWDPTYATSDCWVVKINASGIKEWDKDFGGTDQDRVTAITQTSDGGFLLGAYSSSGMGGDKTQATQGADDFWIIKIDSSGVKQWDRDFGGGDVDYLMSVQQTSDGGFILGGQSASGIGGDKTQNIWGSADYWIIKTDSLGIKQWDMDYGGLGFEALYCLKQTTDGGYILGGVSSSGISGDKTQINRGFDDFWIVKTDSQGTKQWDQGFGGTSDDVIYKLEQTADGGYIFGGLSGSPISGDKTQFSWGGFDFWIVKTDANGSLVWDKDFGGITAEDEFGNLSQTIDHGFLISGTSYSPISGDKSENNLGYEQSWVIKTDSMGIKQWDKTIFTYGHDECGFAIETRDGCFAFANSTSGGIGGYKSQFPYSLSEDFWIVNFCDSTNNLPPTSNFTASVNDFCSGNCTSFNNLSLLANTQLWLFPGGTPSSSIALFPQNICYNVGGSYDVTLITYNIFGSDTLLIPGYITVFPEPNVPNIIQTGDTLIAQAGYVSYQWYYFTNTIPGATNYYYIATQNGDYSVVVTDSNGCDAGRGIVNVLTEANNLNSDLADAIQIFPNPSNGIFMICFNQAFFATQTANVDRINYRIEISDVLGKIIYSDGMNISSLEKSKPIHIDAPAGIYFLKILDDGSMQATKIKIQE